MSELAKYLALKSNDEINNPAKLLENIIAFVAPIAQGSEQIRINRTFNDLKGPYKSFDDLLEYLPTALQNKKFNIWIQYYVANALNELFDEHGNLFPDVWNAINTEKKYLDTIAERNPENNTINVSKTQSVIYRELLSALVNLCSSNILEEINEFFKTSDIDYTNVFKKDLNLDDDTFKELSREQLVNLWSSKAMNILSDELPKELTPKEIQNTKAKAQLDIATSLGSDVANVPHNHHVMTPEKNKETKANAHPHIATSSRSDVAGVPHNNHVKSINNIEEKSFAETRLGKILIASATALIISPILFIAMVAVGITLPISLPIGLAVVAVATSLFTAAATGLVDWIANKFKAKTSEVARNVSEPSTADTYTKLKNAFSSDEYKRLFNFLQKKFEFNVSSDQNKDIKTQLVTLLSKFTLEELVKRFDDAFNNAKDRDTLLKYIEIIDDLVKANNNLGHLLTFKTSAEFIVNENMNKTATEAPELISYNGSRLEMPEGVKIKTTSNHLDSGSKGMKKLGMVADG